MQEPNNNLKEHPDLYKRSIKGGYWVFAIRAATQLLGFVKSIIVFNFLFKANLELVIVANLLMAILTTSTESGFHAALIQKKESIEDYLDTAWVIGILRGILLFSLIYLIAPFFASFRVAPEDVSLAISVIRAMGACFLIRAFQNIGIVYFKKELQFHKTFWLTMAGTLTDIVLSIVLVLMLKSVWGYVIARLAAAVVNLAMTYILCSYWPKFHFIPKKARELWRFGKWLFGGNIIGYLLNEGDDWFVWFYLGADPLKLYRYAYRFSNMPATHITDTISRVSFPAYSKIQHDLPRLREAYLKVLQMTALISVPTAFLIFTLGPDFVRLFLVPEACAMIPVIQVLAIKGLFKSAGSPRSPLFKAMGKPQATWYLLWLRIIILSLIIYPLTAKFGILGTAVSTVLVSCVANPLGFLLACRLLKCPFFKMFKLLLVPIACSVLVTVSLFLAKMTFLVNTSVINLMILIILAAVLYLTMLMIADSIFTLGIRQLARQHFNPLRR